MSTGKFLGLVTGGIILIISGLLVIPKLFKE